MTDLPRRLFFALLVFSPLAFGATETWSLALVGGGSVAALWLSLREARRKELPVYSPPGMLPLALFLAYVFCQAIPLPPLLLHLLSPHTWKLYSETVWVVRPGVWMPVSLAPRATLAEFLRVAGYGAFFLLTVQLLVDRKTLKKIPVFLALFGGGFAFVGILQFLLPNDRILWIVRDWPARTSHHFGTYVNGNHYAGLMEMILPVVLAMFLSAQPEYSYHSLREKIAEFFNHPRANTHILLGFSAILISTSIFLSLSRGGIFSILIALLALGFLAMKHGKDRKKGRQLVLFMVAMLLAVGFLGWGPIFDRFEGIRTSGGEIADQRLDYWEDSRDVIQDFPLFGTGFGTFAHIYPRYQSVYTHGLMVDHAHNDYIELLVEGGIAGTGLVVWFLFAVVSASYRKFSKRRNRTSIYLFLGGLAGLLSILFHSVTDFNLHIGANGLYFFFLLGLVASAAASRSPKSRRKTNLSVMLARRLSRTFVLLGVTALIGGVFYGGAALSAVCMRSFDRLDSLSQTEPKNITAALEQGKLARNLDPLSPQVPFILADLSLAVEDRAQALEYLTAALRLDPTNGEVAQKLGLLLELWGEEEKGKRLLWSGVENNASNPELRKVYASWLFSHGHWEEGLGQVRTAMTWDPRRSRDYLTLLALYGFDAESIDSALPPLCQAQIAFGDYLLDLGFDSRGERTYRRAIPFCTEGESPSTAPFWHLKKFYFDRGRTEEALQAIQQGIELFPRDPGFRREAGFLYERLGVTYRAIEEYRKSLLLDPGKGWVRKRLEILTEGGG